MTEEQTDKVLTTTLWVGGGITLATLAAYVVLELAGVSTTALVAFMGPVIGALLVADHVTRTTRATARKLDKIDTNTNGALTARIQNAVRAALVDTGGPIVSTPRRNESPLRTE